MSYLTTGLDLKLDALGLAGEPNDGTSSYTDQQVYEWLTVTQRGVVSGGFFGPSYLQPADWYWARAWPRGAIQLVQPFNQTFAFSATFTAGSITVTTPGFAPDLSGWRIFRPDVPARHLIDHVDNSTTPQTTIFLREAWTGDSGLTFDWLAYPDTYLLPPDFVRGTSPLFNFAFPSNLPTQPYIDVIDPVDMERMYPQAYPWSQGNTTIGGGVPIVAARVTQNRLRFSHFLNTVNSTNPIQLEFEYIRRPDVIAEGTIPTIPIEHRRILSYGCAMLILDDKKSSQMDSLRAHFEQSYKAMRDEHARDMRRMSSRSGVVQPPRASGNRNIILTESGLPVYIW